MMAAAALAACLVACAPDVGGQPTSAPDVKAVLVAARAAIDDGPVAG